MACKHANLMHGIVSMCAEVKSHSAPRSAGGSRSKWTSRWSGRRAAPRRRWRRGRQWSPRRGLPRPGQGQSSPANTKNRKLRNELVVLCFPLPKTKDQIPSYLQEPPAYSCYVVYGFVFLFKPLCAIGGAVTLSLSVLCLPALPVFLLLMMYRDGSRGGGGECCACAGV